MKFLKIWMRDINWILLKAELGLEVLILSIFFTFQARKIKISYSIPIKVLFKSDMKLQKTNK